MEAKEKEKRTPPPELIYPTDTKKTQAVTKKMAQALKKHDEGALNVRVVKDIDMTAGSFTVLCALIIFMISFGILMMRTDNPRFSLSVSLILAWGSIALFWKHICVSVPARMAKVYLNNLFHREIVVYLNGFHFLWTTFSRQSDVIDFQKQKEISSREADNNAPSFMSLDGWEVRAAWAGLIRRRNDENSLSHSLNYPDRVVEYWLRVMMNACLADLGGENSYDSMRAYKEDAIAWVRRVFAGEEGEMIDFGKVVGYDIELQLESVNLANEEDRKSKAAIGRAAIMRQQALENKEKFKGMTDNDAFDNAGIAEELVTKNIIEIKGLPPGGMFVMGGDVSSLVKAKGGKK
jgi:hypothetical protein